MRGTEENQIDASQKAQLDPSLTWHCRSVYVSALLAAAEDGGGGTVEEEWLEVSGGAEALGRSLQRALINRVCNTAPPELRVCPSAIPGGGQGLFAQKDFAPGMTFERRVSYDIQHKQIRQ